jgi:hypothetical protein
MFGIVPVLFSANIGMMESVDGVVLGLSETVAGLRWYNNTGTIPNIDYTRLAEEIIRLQNRNTMEEVQPASSSGNFCADSHTANTSSVGI